MSFLKKGSVIKHLILKYPKKEGGDGTFSGKGESPLRGLSDRKVECGRDS